MSARDARGARSAAPAESGGLPGWALVIAALAGLAVTAGVLAAILWPALGSALAAEPADGSRAFGVAADLSPDTASATVRPAADWSVRPVADGELVLQSPDRKLTVELSVVPAADADAALAEAAEDAPVLSEVLASGLVLRHATLDERLIGVLASGEAAVETVLVEASVEPPAELADYRPALGALLESVELG